MSKWMPRIGLAAIAALLLVAGLAVSAKILASPPTQGAAALQAGPTDTPVAVAAQVSPPPSAQAICETALETMTGLDAWRVEAEGDVVAQFRSLTLQVPVSYDGRFRAPDRLEGTGSVQILGITLKKDLVLLGRTTTVTRPGSGGGGAMAKPATMLSLFDFAGLEPAAIRDLTFVGEETLDGTPVYHVKGSLMTGPMQFNEGGAKLKLQGQVLFDLWIGVADHLPRRVTAEGKLTSSGTAAGTLTVAGSATFSEFGQPVVIEPEERPVTAASCQTAEPGFVAYSHAATTTRFCHPSDWVVDELVKPCGCFAVSPNGVVPAIRAPDHIVLVHPPATVAQVDSAPTGIFKLGGQTGICTAQFVRSALSRRGVRSLADLQREAASLLASGLFRKEPIVAFASGIEYDGAKTLAIGYLADEKAHRPTIEAILGSIVAGP
jgi:hypothetical protein